MKKTCYIFIVVYFLLVGCSTAESKHKLEVNLDTIKIIPANQKWASFDELNIKGLKIGDVEKLYGERSHLYWNRETHKDKNDFPEGYEGLFTGIKYPADIIAYVWERSVQDSTYLTVFFVIDGKDTITIYGDQVDYNVYFLE
ncbi:MAG: hypothetical protein IJ916_04080 [Paludibacteraceae bacterium]|nr:hypothetical protein [Paludibacteraceae bacterium]